MSPSTSIEIQAVETTPRAAPAPCKGAAVSLEDSVSHWRRRRARDCGVDPHPSGCVHAVAAARWGFVLSFVSLLPLVVWLILVGRRLLQLESGTERHASGNAVR